MSYYTLSVKCTNNTKQNLNILFNRHPLFQRLKESGVSPNPSWFFKFSSSIFLKNIDNPHLLQKIENFEEFAYNCHYVKNFDDLLESVLINKKKKG